MNNFQNYLNARKLKRLTESNLIHLMLWLQLKASHSMLDDVYPSEEQNQRLHEEYGTNDWDSDIEDSNSSEEFLYTKETTELYEYLNNRSNSQPSSSKNVVPHSIENNHCGATTDEIDEVKSSSMQNESESDQRSNDEPTDTQEIWNVWNSHEDLIAVSTNGMHINQLTM